MMNTPVADSPSWSLFVSKEVCEDIFSAESDENKEKFMTIYEQGNNFHFTFFERYSSATLTYSCYFVKVLY